MSQKTWRKPYRGSRRFDPTCRSHGGCPWCLGSRLRYRRVHEEIAESEGVKGGRWVGDSWRSASGFETSDGDDPARLALSIVAAPTLSGQGNSEARA